MKYISIALFLILLSGSLYFAVRQVNADVNTSVNISNNGEGSSSHVNVQNDINSSTINNSSQSNTHTDVRIETNGKVKTYSSDQPGDVTIQSDDGTSTVHINNNSSNNNINSTATPRVTREQITQQVQQIQNQNQQKINDEKARIDMEKKKAEERKNQIIKDSEERNFDIRKFIESELQSLKDLLKSKLNI